MTERNSLPTISKAEYEAIEAAVMETARGRWFLNEFARRNRNADTNLLLDAIAKLGNAVTGERAAQSLDRLRFDLKEMAKAITRTKAEIAAIRPADHPHSHLTEATEALDGILRTTERATSEILEAAEHIQEAAWTLREQGANELLCDDLDRRATEIYTACGFQDVTAQRTSKVVQTLRYLEGRINAMVDIWSDGDDHPSGPAPGRSDDEPNGLSQSDVDVVIVENELFSHQPLSDRSGADESLPPARGPDGLDGDGSESPAMDAEPASSPALLPETLAEIDALDMREKLRRFT